MIVKNLELAYGKNVMIKDLSFSLEKGEVLAVLGENGAGKTTLLKSLLGLRQIEGGSIEIEGRPLSELSAWERSKNMSAVFSKNQASDWVRVKDILEIARESNLGLKAESWKNGCERYGLLSLFNRELGSLSDGEKQRVFLWAALMQETPYLFLDEPTAHLDPIRTKVFMKYLNAEMKQHEMSVFWNTHQWELAQKYATKILLLKGKGEFWLGTTHESKDVLEGYEEKRLNLF